MKLSMWSAYYIELSPEDMVLELEKHAYRHSELSDEHSVMLMERGDATEVGRAFGAFARAHQVKFSQGHLKLSAHLCEAQDRAFFKRQLDLFRAIGIRYAVLHYDELLRYGPLPLEEVRARNVEALRDLLAHVADSDIVICLENLILTPVGQTAEQLMWFIDTLQDPHLGICLDTGHLNLQQQRDQVHFIQTAGKHLKALHLTDNDGSGDQHLMPSARGQVDFAAVIRATRAVGYTGLYNYEVPGERQAPLPVKGFKLDYIRKLTQYYWQCSEEE